MRKRSCECGTCPPCRSLEAGRRFRERNPDYMANYSRHYNDARDPRRIERRAQKERDLQHFTPEEDALLGTMQDKHVAELTGRRIGAISKRRYRLGVAAFRKTGGASRRHENGYVSIVLAADDPLVEMTRHNRSLMEHRLVMARHLNRPLTRDEIVHHKNGIKDDNRIENLELWTRSHPDGQRVHDVFEWCIEFIERYTRELDQPEPTTGHSLFDMTLGN